MLTGNKLTQLKSKSYWEQGKCSILFKLGNFPTFLLLVGNIPYEATEEQLKDIFSEVGLVVSFRWVKDVVLIFDCVSYMVKLDTAE